MTETGTGTGAPRPLSVCLINPKFEPSFWGYDFVLPLVPGDKKCWVATGALPALAALSPAHCTVRLIDENVEPIDFASLAHFDVIGVTGMIVQKRRMLEILSALRTLPAVIVAGGPYVSVAEENFTGACDVRFIGEAETTWPEFLNVLGMGQPFQERYAQAEKTDMTTVPPPRYDLLQANRYAMASLQFSRGCPFTCEFCDIITIFGRRPRLKTVGQMLAEFEGIRRAGFRVCFLVDDNLIGNKNEAKKLLSALADWQAANAYPIQLVAEASVNLADDAELIELMVRANVRQVFIGIESPSKASLAETKKIQNIRGDGLQAKLQRIRDGGLVVQAGFIVGFDADDETIFDAQYDFIQEVGIANAIVAILSPIPTTPLYDRLSAAGRIDFGDPQVIFHPAKMSRETLKAGYGALMQRLYRPEAYFGRLFAGYAGSPAFRARRRALETAARGRVSTTRAALQAVGALGQAGKLWRAMSGTPARMQLAAAYAKAWLTLNLPLGPERMPLPAFVQLCLVHWHFFNIAHRPTKADFGMVIPTVVPEAPPQNSAAA